MNCKELSEITLPENLKTVEEMAFNTTQIKNVRIPAQVSSIDPTSFWTMVLESFEVDEANTVYEAHDGVLFSKTGARLIRCPETIQKYDIPDTVKVIGPKAFANTGIAEVSIPDGVEAIEEEAFYQCRIITLTMPDSVKELGKRIFKYCTGLEKVELGSGLEMTPSE